jgi:hypothetical protein
VGQLFNLSRTLLKVFTGLVRAWQEQVQMDIPVPPNEFFEDVDAKYKPLVDELFASKE